ncbi:hypothetical protein ETB97_004849 [Aspergillus alliaceus]|uniref:Uncharacterized protein n=1 Tax=Petromyces alliaceus TaxID=209559 RepID=A0A8H6ADZ7_PETAA|nr:hypothetical protein ETB97_004849 [Aspergillus burnettii]
MSAQTEGEGATSYAAHGPLIGTKYKRMGNRKGQGFAYMRSQAHPPGRCSLLFWNLAQSQARKSMIAHRSEEDHQQVHGSAVDHETHVKVHRLRATLIESLGEHDIQADEATPIANS